MAEALEKWPIEIFSRLLPRVYQIVEEINRRFWDEMRYKGVDEGKKSVAFNLTLRADDRSLTSEEADADVKAVLELLEQELGAVLR